MKTSLLAIISYILFISCASSQASNVFDSTFQKRNYCAIDIGGYNFFYGMYFERILINNQNFKTSGQIGYGMGGIPVLVHEILSLKKSHIEIGLGILFPNHFSSETFLNEKSFLIGRVGYRLQGPTSRVFLKIGISPLISENTYGPTLTDGQKRTWLWPELSFGFGF